MSFGVNVILGARLTEVLFASTVRLPIKLERNKLIPCTRDTRHMYKLGFSFYLIHTHSLTIPYNSLKVAGAQSSPLAVSSAEPPRRWNAITLIFR